MRLLGHAQLCISSYMGVAVCYLGAWLGLF